MRNSRVWALLPVLGLLINLYLMTQLGINNWTRLFIWLVIGLFIYFGYRNSQLGRPAAADVAV